jgi:hypothetical protein
MKGIKIFGIGLSRTGTSSLTKALNLLGLRVIHYPSDVITYQELSHGNYKLSILEKYDGITDIVCSPFFVQFDQTYPNSKFILTIRDIESWLVSLESHWASREDYLSHDKTDIRSNIVRFYRAVTYGINSFSKQRLEYVYQRHEIEVREYFVNRPESLLIINITAGDGWQKLCKFLDLPNPEQPFPWENASF